ncbi:MAG: disulfide bond formation protein B [Pseudomonadales bacterium]|jgi:disulfide bond formation protein DsbB|nr:disulfide bond formation protein B [Pseudomonadales bacterium]
MNQLAARLPNPRLLNGLIFLFCAAMIGVALYMEHSMMLDPCPLCIMQRVFFIATGFVALAGALHNPAATGRRVYAALSTLTALAGAGFALRQIYLQHLPEEMKIQMQCGASISYMWETDFPMSTILKTLFTGDGDCTKVVWVDPVIGLGIPEWSLIGFVMLAGAGAFQFLRKA